MTQHFLPLFFGDFLASTAEWSGEERSLYLLCLAYQWSMGSLPVEPKRLAKLVDWERRSFDGAWEQVSKKFVEQDGRLFNLRLEQHRQKSMEIGKKRANAGAKGAANRWQKDSNCQTVANGNEIAIATNLPCHPSHPTPIQESKKGESAIPPDPHELIFSLGIQLCGESNRSLLGRLVKEHGKEAVAAKIGEMAAMTQRPVAPHTWLIACLQSRETKTSRFKTA